MTDGSSAEVWVKMEAANPTGSYKDRMALAMIEAAEADGRLRPGQLVVEDTGGGTGSSPGVRFPGEGVPPPGRVPPEFRPPHSPHTHTLGRAVPQHPRAPP